MGKGKSKQFHPMRFAKKTVPGVGRLPKPIKAKLPCRVCGRVFKTDDGLTHHMKNKHGDNV